MVTTRTKTELIPGKQNFLCQQSRGRSIHVLSRGSAQEILPTTLQVQWKAFIIFFPGIFHSNSSHLVEMVAYIPFIQVRNVL
jgi:hypothetical protein